MLKWKQNNQSAGASPPVAFSVVQRGHREYIEEIRIVSKIAINLTFVIGSFVSVIAAADEPAERFLQALRDEGYFDIAVDYLSGLENSDLISDAFRQQLPFEKAETMVASVKTVRDPKIADARLNEAQKILTEFAGKDQSLESLARTLRYQGNLYHSRVKVNDLLGASDRLTATEKEVFADQSRELLKNALQSYQEAREKVRQLIDPASPVGLKIDPQDPATLAKVKQFKVLYTDIRVRIPLVIEQLADTYPDNHPQRITDLTNAVGEYKDVYADYSSFPAGLDALLFAARCSQKLGQHKEAVFLLEDIFNLNDSSTFRKLKRSAFLVACDSWNKLETYPAAEISARLEPVVAVLNREEIRDPAWLRIQMELAIVKHQLAVEVRAAGGARSSSDSDDLDRQAAKLLRGIVRIPGDHRERAEQLISEWNISIAAKTEPESKAPATFVDAKQQAQDLVLEIETLLGENSQLKRQLASAAESDKPSTKTLLAESTERLNEQALAALTVLDSTLDLADDTTARADINSVRSLQSFCYFAMGQYFESAVIGEFLLEKYPTVDGTRAATTLMIQSYLQLYDQAAEADKSYELGRLSRACTAVVERWPGSSETGLAASTLVRLAITQKDFATAEQYFAQLPENYAGRSQLASRLGQRMWFDYRSKLANTVDRQILDPQLKQAKVFLELGAREATLDKLDYETALGCLLLVDAHLEAGEIELAVQRLENSEIAPLDLIKQKHPAITQSPAASLFRQESYKIAIKAYLASIHHSDNPQAWIDKASGVIAAMREDMEANDDPQARQRVTQIYGLIATELLAQFEALSSVEEKAKFANSLLSFLASIEKDSNDARIVLWAGSTLLNVAQSVNDLGQPNEAKPLYQQAVSALSRAETLGFAGDPQAPAMTTELQRQRALAQRGSGNFEEAIEQFALILEKNPRNLKVQLNAAETLQAWGKSAGRSKLYTEAVMGARPFTDPTTKRPSKLIWGWEKICTATRGNEKTQDAFYQSLYQLAECRMEYGLLEQKKEAIASALQEIENAEKRDPELGGAIWKRKFLELKNQIKQNMPQ